MIIVGLTGGIGSGKSTYAKLLAKKGIPIYYSDDRAKYLMNNSKELRDKLLKEFGRETFNTEGLNREYLAKIVFNNKEKLEILNSIVHPIVTKDFKSWTNEQSTSFVVNENAILFESGAYKNCDININISTDVEERIGRVMKRDGATRDQVLSRINNQWTDEQRNDISDITVSNNDVDNTADNISYIIEKLNSN